jgi:hypothetical protein
MAAPDQIGGGFGAKTLGIPPASFPGRIYRQGSAAGAIAPVAADRRPGQARTRQARPGRATIALAPRGAWTVAKGTVAKGALTEGAVALGLVAKTICGGAITEGAIALGLVAKAVCGGAVAEGAIAEGTIARRAGGTGSTAKAALANAAAGIAPALAAAPILPSSRPVSAAPLGLRLESRRSNWLRWRSRRP